MPPGEYYLKTDKTATVYGEKPGLYRPCAMCAKLERALHDAIKTIERLQKTLEGYEKERENVKP